MYLVGHEWLCEQLSVLGQYEDVESGVLCKVWNAPTHTTLCSECVSGCVSSSIHCTNMRLGKLVFRYIQPCVMTVWIFECQLS